MHDRRTFLTTLAAMAAGCALPGGGARDDRPRPLARVARPLGLQLYTVRGLLARDFAGTLERVTALGYQEVEFAGYHGLAPARVREVLDGLGVTAPSAHVALEDVEAAWPRVLDDAATVGHRWITVPWVPGRDWDVADWRRLAALLNARGAEAARHGRRIAYHNHDFELRRDLMPDGETPLALLLAGTDPALVDFELDVYWLVRAGHDPVAWLARYPGRVPMLHVKDSAGPPQHRMVDVGAGTIDWAAVLAAARRGGARHLFVEHDQPVDAMQTARAGFAHLAHLHERAAP